MISNTILENIAHYSDERINSIEIIKDNFVSVDNLNPNKQGVSMATFEPKGTLIRFRKGDVLIGNIRPYLKKIWFANRDGGCSPDVLVIRAKENTHPKFLYYSLFRNDLFEHMMNGAKGTKMPRGDKKQILKFHTPNLPYRDQEQIANILSSLDSKIEINNKVNKELEAMAKTIYDYWFVQFDFPNTKGKPYKSSGGKMVWNEELKREIPEGWDVSSLESILSEFTKGLTTEYVEHSDLINLNQKVNKGFNLERQYFKYLNPSIEVPSQKYARKGDILINSLGQGTLGRIHPFKDDLTNIVVDQHLFILRVNKTKITSTFLYFLLSSKPFQTQIDRQITGSTGMQMLNANNLKEILILKPKVEVTHEFEKIVSNSFDLISNNDKQNQQLASLRDWLLPMLMNGQVRVKDVEEELGMAAEVKTLYKKSFNKK